MLTASIAAIIEAFFMQQVTIFYLFNRVFARFLYENRKICQFGAT